MEKPYTESKWRGIPTYQCRFCPFDTRSLEKAEKHYNSVHLGLKELEAPPQILVADASGREITLPKEVLTLPETRTMMASAKGVEVVEEPASGKNPKAPKGRKASKEKETE